MQLPNLIRMIEQAETPEQIPAQWRQNQRKQKRRYTKNE